jgi:hypothetical protein
MATKIQKKFWGIKDASVYNPELVKKLVNEFMVRPDLTKGQKSKLLKGLSTTISNEGVKMDTDDRAQSIRLLEWAIDQLGVYGPGPSSQPSLGVDGDGNVIDTTADSPPVLDVYGSPSPGTAIDNPEMYNPDSIDQPFPDLTLIDEAPRKEVLAPTMPTAASLPGAQQSMVEEDDDGPKAPLIPPNAQSSTAGGRTVMEDETSYRTKANRFDAFTSEEKRVMKEALKRYARN